MYELKNHTESVVKKALKSYLEKNKLRCDCELCQLDILSLTLNKLPSRYYVSARGEILINCESQSIPDQGKVMVALTRAVQKVAEFPSHPVDLPNTYTEQDQKNSEKKND